MSHGMVLVANLICGSIGTSQDTMSVSLTFDPVALVLVSVGVHLMTLAMAMVAMEFTLVATSLSIS